MANASEVLDTIKSTRGRFFGATFTKKNGETRRMNAISCPDYDPPHWSPEDKGMLVVYDVQEDGFRTIKADTVERLSFGGKTIMFD